MRSLLRVVATLLGVVFAVQGVGWLIAPQRAAAGLGMPLLDGLGRSTQIGDFAAFFLTLGVSILVGQRPSQAGVLYVPAGLLGGAALCRIVSWAAHGAAFAGLFITVELVACLLLLAQASGAQR